MVILFFVAFVLYWLSKYIEKGKYKLRATSIGLASIGTILFLLFGITNIEMLEDSKAIETIINENYSIEIEVTDMLYYYHMDKYPNGEMSFDPEASISLVALYPEAKDDKVINKLVDRYYFNKIQLMEHHKSYNINKAIKTWCINFNLW